MPGQYQLSLDRLPQALSEIAELELPAVILFMACLEMALYRMFKRRGWM